MAYSDGFFVDLYLALFHSDLPHPCCSYLYYILKRVVNVDAVFQAIFVIQRVLHGHYKIDC